MSFQYLHPPPVEFEVTENKKISTPYQKYFTNLNGAITSHLKSITYVDGVTGATRQGQAPLMFSYTTAEINSIQNPVNGMIVYDSTINDFKFRVNNAWVVKT